MTNKYNNWERILEILEWTGLSLTQLAMKLDMSRTENLYSIKRGHYGISSDLADRLCELYPDLDRTWLLSGVGSMLLSTKSKNPQRPYYRSMAEDSITNINQLKPSGVVSMPHINGYDFIIRSASKAMCDKQCAATDLFLRSVELDEIVQGNEYVLEIDGEAIWRKVRVKRNSSEWRLVSRFKSEYPDIIVDRSKITRAWRVIARLAIMTS